jgi:hypothetical protein
MTAFVLVAERKATAIAAASVAAAVSTGARPWQM